MNDIIVILHRPQDPRNIGAVVRAMLNTGFRHLRLVAPAPFDHELIAAVAHRPEPILATLTGYTDMTSAVADVRYLVGTSDRPHPGVPWRNDVLKRDVWYTRYCSRLPSRKAWIETSRSTNCNRFRHHQRHPHHPLNRPPILQRLIGFLRSSTNFSLRPSLLRVAMAAHSINACAQSSLVLHLANATLRLSRLCYAKQCDD